MSRKTKRRVQVRQPQSEPAKPRQSLGFVSLGALGFPGLRIATEVTPFYWSLSFGWTTRRWLIESMVCQIGPISVVAYVAGSEPTVKAPVFKVLRK